jgi:hypothetical protein
VRTYEGGPPDVRSANSTGGCTLLFEYPLDNTWTYETAIEPLGKNHRTYAPWLDVRYFFGSINSTLPFRISHHFHMPLGYQSVSRMFSKCFECVVSVCVRRLQVWNIREAKLLRFCFKEVTFDP